MTTRHDSAGRGRVASETKNQWHVSDVTGQSCKFGLREKWQFSSFTGNQLTLVLTLFGKQGHHGVFLRINTVFTAMVLYVDPMEIRLMEAAMPHF